MNVVTPPWHDRQMSRLLERQDQLDALAEAMSAAADGGVIVLVHGEAGAGKSSLVRAFLAGLPPASRTFVGACDDLITPRPLGPFRDAVRWRGGSLADALAGKGDVFDAVIEELSHPRDVTLLVIEDVHWADDATLDVLQFVLRRMADLRAVVVLTYRDDELRPEHPLRPLLGAATGTALRRIQIPRLSTAAVAALAAGSGHDPDTVYAVTEGNAFFVTEMLAVGTTDVPATVVDAVLSRVRLLPEPAQRALQQLSVVPTRVEHWLVERLVGGLDNLKEAEQSGVLRVDREHVAFRHELARRALEQTLPTTRRVTLNRTLVDALEDAPEIDVARVVHHAIEAGDVDQIVAYAPVAAREAASAGSHRQALAFLREALRHEQHLPDRERARVLGEYSWELYNAHRFNDAAAAAQRSVDLWRSLDEPVELGLALVWLSRHRWMSNEITAAWDAINEATEVLEPSGDVVARAQAHLYRGSMYVMQGHGDAQITEIQLAQSLAESGGADDLVLLCVVYEACARWLAGDETTGKSMLREAIELSKQQHDRDRQHRHRAFSGEPMGRAYANFAGMLAFSKRYEELRAMLPEALSFTQDLGLSLYEYILRAKHAELLVHDGEWDAAETEYGELDRDVTRPGNLGRFMLPVYARLLARRAAPDADAVVARAVELAAATAFWTAPTEAAIASVEAAWLAGRPHQAAMRFTEVYAWLQPDRDRPLLAELLRYAKRAGLYDGDGFDGCPEPWASGLRGDWQQAAAGWEQLGDDYERALELAESGDVTVMTQALGILDRLGATAAASNVRQRLRELGVRNVPRGPQPATKRNPAGLTERQVEVLALVAQGMTNAEISDKLVVSVRTVDHHVAAILDKLHVPSRRAAAERAVELGI
jgi:ATP/maltotriose-dependent transcriptional regulator MalT